MILLIINKLILQDFRAFRGYHEFDFSDKRIILINGPNGHGKSTIFDAINWVFLGKLNRYTGSIEHKRFNYIVNNRAKAEGEYTSFVQIELIDNNNRVCVIKRELRHNSSEKVYINSRQIDYDKISEKIAEILVESSSVEFEDEDNVVDLGALVSSTQILSQEDLDEFVRGNKPGERYKKLEKILGFKKYGEDFKEFLNQAKSITTKQLQELENKEREIANKKNVIEAKYDEQKKIYQNVGRITESQLLQDIKDINIKVVAPFVSEGVLPLNINEINNDSLEKLRDLKEEISLKLSLVIDLENEIKAKGLSKYNYIKLIQERRILDRKITHYKNLIEDRKSWINKAYSKINNLEKLEISIRKIHSMNTEIYSIEDDLNILKSSIETLSNSPEINKIKEQMGIEEFQQLYDNRKKLLSDLEIWLEVNKNEESVLKYKQEIAQLKNILEQDTKKIENINKETLLYETKVKKLNEKIEYKEESQIEQFIYDVQNHILNMQHNDSECPVCGTDFRSNNKTLKEHVTEKLKRSKEELNGLEQEKLRLVNTYNELKSDSNDVLKMLEKNKGNIKGLEEQISILNTRNINLKSKIKEYHNNDGLLSTQANIEKINSFLKKYKHVYNDISIILNKVSQRKVLEQTIENKKLEVGIEKKSIPPKYSIYLESNTKLINKKKILEDYIDLTKGKIKNINRDLDNNLFEYEESKKSIQEAIKIFQKIQRGFNYSFSFLDSENILIDIQEKKSNFNYLIQQLETILYNIYSYLTHNEFSQLKNEKEQISNNLVRLNKRIEKNKATLESIEEFMKGHKSVQTRLLNQYLEEQSKNINFYFKQISPHAFYKNVKLVAMKQELYILLLEEGEEIPSFDYEVLKNEVNASLTFSAAQSTILALSIFLSLNSTHNWSNLRVLGIDDPFQNLDDVNIFSFVDVISALINQKQKQVFLSTHSNDFPKLITSKIDLNDNEIGNITFLSYSQEKMLISSNVHTYKEK